MNGAASRDPRWERVVEIASKLWIDGIYVVEIDASRTQRFVDLHWSALQAGRLLGGRAKLEKSDARGPDDPTVKVTVRFFDPDGKGMLRAEEGMQKLVREVLSEHRRMT